MERLKFVSVLYQSTASAGFSRALEFLHLDSKRGRS
jgi:hypothetical protein